MTALVPIRLECLSLCDCAEFVLNETPLPGAAGLCHLHCSACTHPLHMHASPDILETSPLYQYRRRGLAANQCNGFYPENRSLMCCDVADTGHSPMEYQYVLHLWGPLACSQVISQHAQNEDVPSYPAQPTIHGSQTPSLQDSHQSGQTSASPVASETRRNLLRANIPPPVAAFSGIKTSTSDRATDLRNASRLSSLPQHRKKKGSKPSSLNPDKTGNMNLVVFIYPLCEAAERGNYLVPGLEKYKANHPRDNEVLRYETSFPIREGRYTFEPTGRIGPGDTVTREILQKLCKDFNPLPLGPSNDFFLVVAPRFGHITSSLHGFTCHDEPPQVSEVHNCWPYRVLYEAGKPFYRFNRIQGNKPLAAWPNPITCDDQCPQENTDMEAEADSPSSPTTNIIEILDSPSPGGFSPPPLEVALLARHARTNLVPSSSPFPPSSPVLPSSPLLLPSPGHVQFPSPLSSPCLTSHSLAGSLDELSDEKLVLHWRKKIYSQVKMRFPEHRIEMEGPSVLRLAQITWAWFQHTINSPSEDFPMEEFGDVTKFSPRSILFESQNLLQQHFRQYRIRGVSSRSASVGPGLECAVILACLHDMVQNTDYWRRRANGTFTLYLSASRYKQPRRKVYMEASGHLLAWSLLHLGQGFIVSHWVTLAVVGGIEAFSTLTYEAISAIEEADAQSDSDRLRLSTYKAVVRVQGE
ncbi:hypothetical protein ARMSODRAFT_981830 [Armillaria solidipes]|uniref:Uncharacterized protein n=1 Tax=Armillaria solidipes TaxID=1076256 RepID=A0A2H3AQM6_9AGAR|nr:hypothetical protein ARMSODRAFT_981830 [Armillaria solidipes]